MDFIFIVLFISFGLLFINLFAAELGDKDKGTLKKLYLFHLLMGTYYCFFINGDAILHWEAAKSMTYDDFIRALTEGQGTDFTRALNYFPSKLLDLSYFTGTILYSVIGFIGLAYFYKLALTFIPYNSKFMGFYLFPTLFFLPNLHFWSCAVGKDTMLFFCIALFVYGLVNPFRRLPMIIIALLLAYFIRPHVVLFLLMGFALAYFSASNVSSFQRFLFFGLTVGIFIAILPSVLKYTKVEQLSVGSFDKFASNQARLLSGSKTGSAIDISSYPFPLKVFAFLYRPFFFDINGIPAVIASFENLLLFLLTLNVFKYKPLFIFKNSPFIIKGLVYFLIISTIAFSNSMGNIGIMIRMRNMVLPGLLLFILWSYSQRRDVVH